MFNNIGSSYIAFLKQRYYIFWYALPFTPDDHVTVRFFKSFSRLLKYLGSLFWNMISYIRILMLILHWLWCHVILRSANTTFALLIPSIPSSCPPLTSSTASTLIICRYTTIINIVAILVSSSFLHWRIRFTLVSCRSFTHCERISLILLNLLYPKYNYKDDKPWNLFTNSTVRS